MVGSAAITGFLLRQVSGVPPWGEFVVVSAIAIAAARAVAERQHVYELPVLLDPLANLSQIGLCLAAGAVASAGSLFLLHPYSPELPYLVAQPASWALASGAALLSFRSLVAARLQRHTESGRLSTRIALIGANEASLRFIADTARDPRVKILGIYDDRTTRLAAGDAKGWLRGTISDLVVQIRQHPVDAIVISLPLTAPERITDMRERLAGIAADVFLTADIPELSSAGARFTTLGTSPVLSVTSRPLKDWPAFKKTAFDRCASGVSLLLALPIMAVIAVAIKLGSRGPILFQQEREGLNGVPFTLLKFRTMYVRQGADEGIQATKNDSRVTWIGVWLRRYSLDELPQLWNILRGDMSLVGPRPHLATTRAGKRLFGEVVPHYQARHRMKPGLTGWAQVQGLRGETRTERELVERVAQDLYYIDNWSLGLDLKIIARTVLREIVSVSGRAY